jgi:uroporphyrinogen III methyltransferase/synthase
VRDLEQAGVRVWPVPVIAHEAAEDLTALDAALAGLEAFDWVTFTSARAVAVVSGRPAWRRWPWRSYRRPRVAAVGPSTRSRLAENGIEAAVCPPDAGAAGLAAALAAADGSLEGRAVLWPRSEIARPDLRDALVAAGARVTDPVTYRTTATRPADIASFLCELGAGAVDAVTFLSPSSAEHLAAAIDGGTLSVLADRTIVASIGPSTSEALVRLGAPPGVQAADHTASGLASALVNCLAQREGATS